ncbi:VWA domain-containing protein [Polaribacter litorisediminis]|nr:VWA domain-containing protein [Polaribacter litorisediminis]
MNPTIKKTEIINIKPVLSVLVDNSKSTSYFKEDKNVIDIIKRIEENSELKNKFEIQKFTFGNSLQAFDSLSFSDKQTNISEAIIGIKNLQKNRISPIVLISDGNQTIGSDYEFINLESAMYPLVIGDTATYIDIKITQLNVNKYSYLKNKFPVEVLLNYEGDKNVTTQFSIISNGKTLFRKNVSFSSSKKSATIVANLTSLKQGLQYYTASISKIENEKNIKNNTKNFSVEVIDEQTKVLLLTSMVHPDIGAFKKSIESNKQRSVEVFKIDTFKNQLNDYQLVILYQPNNKFQKIISQLKQSNRNYLVVSGAQTDWTFLNQKELGFQKNAINQTENYGAIYNDSFLTFLQEDIGFNNYPPLKDKFGEVFMTKEHQTLVYQSSNGIETQQPLLATFDVNNQKSAILLGEGIWKWRATSFLNSNSFEDFDKFIGNLVQYLASNKKRDRLVVNAETLYPANATITISAFYTDKNYQFDARASLEIALTNIETKEVTSLPFSLVNKSYQTAIENLISGDYTYKVSVLGQKINRYGRFKITEYDIEEQFTNANVNKLQKLADKTGGRLFFKNQENELIEELLENKSYYTVQKSATTQKNLMDWQWIVFVILGLLTAEWFVRKYFGKI